MTASTTATVPRHSRRETMIRKRWWAGALLACGSWCAGVEAQAQPWAPPVDAPRAVAPLDTTSRWIAPPGSEVPPLGAPAITPLPSVSLAPPTRPLELEQPEPLFTPSLSQGNVLLTSADQPPAPPTAGKIAADDKGAAAGDAKRMSAIEKGYDELSKKFKAFTDKADGFPRHRLTGFTQLDTAYYSQSALNKSILGDAQNGTGFRRARLAVQGQVAEFTNYQIEMDFATAGRPSFFDTYIDQGNIFFLGNVRVGQFCQPFSVDALTGFRNLTFLERSLPFLTFVPFRRVGISSANQNEDQSTAWTYSVFRTGAFNNAPLGDNRYATDFGDGDGYSFSGRMTHLLWYDDLVEDRYLWHVGGGYNFSMLGRNSATGSGTTGNAGGGPAPFYQARTLPEFGPLGYSENGGSFGNTVNTTPLILDSGRYEASSFNLFGVETLGQWGPWAFTSEWMATQVNSVVGPVYYNGAYAQLAYKITGEHRAYDKKSGILTKLTPYTDFIPLKRDGIRGWGAWEVGARWSYVDLINPAALTGHYYNSATNTYTGSAVTGAIGNGAAQNATLGVTWFLNVHTKLQANWIHSMIQNRSRGYSAMDLFVMRAQVDY